jgi:hypothetical protein
MKPPGEALGIAAGGFFISARSCDRPIVQRTSNALTGSVPGRFGHREVMECPRSPVFMNVAGGGQSAECDFKATGAGESNRNGRFRRIGSASLMDKFRFVWLN